ncbi:HD-GYP domain-containing protein [Planctomycetota bacterium]
MLDAIGKTVNSSQMSELKKFGERVSNFGADFAVCDNEGHLIVLCKGGRFETCTDVLIECSQKTMEQNNSQSISTSEPSIFEFEGHNGILTTLLETGLDTVVAVIDLPDTLTVCDNSSKTTKENNLVNKVFSELLALFAKQFQSNAKAAEQIEMVSIELAQVYEELVLLHRLNTHMNLTEADGTFLQMACDCLTDIVNVEGIAILLEKKVDSDKCLNLAAGWGLIDIDERMAGVLHNRLVDEISSGHEALLDSEVDSPFRYDWPSNIKNIIVVPLFSKDKGGAGSASELQNISGIIGFIIAINRADKPDFDSTDVKLFTSVAGSCAVFIENGRLFRDLEELFIGSLRALTNSIDAKDQYTRGHSERVAFISKWIADILAEQGEMKKDDVPMIYLAGLLHDIGKMGIDEKVLRKNGALTEKERECIMTHSAIGASILSEIKQMKDIIPAVLYHHERIDGKGYPTGMDGEKIPLISKIIGLADSFDAMTSKRTYRDAMTIEQALEEIEKGLDSQFDMKVGRIFLNSDVYRLWDIMQKSTGGGYDNQVLSEYGSLAVGTLVR